METKEKNLSFVSHRPWNDKKAYYSLDEVSVLIEDILAYAEALREKKDNRLKNGLYRYDYANIAPDILYKLKEENKLKLASPQVLLALGQGADFFPLVCEIKNIQSKLGMGKIGNSGQLDLSSEAPLFNTWITRLLPKRNWKIRKTAPVWGRCFSLQIFLIVSIFQGWSLHWSYL